MLKNILLAGFIALSQSLATDDIFSDPNNALFLWYTDFRPKIQTQLEIAAKAPIKLEKESIFFLALSMSG